MKRYCLFIAVAACVGCGDGAKVADPRPADPSKAPQLKQLTEGAPGTPKAPTPPQSAPISKTP
jgi:hypothetical protein